MPSSRGSVSASEKVELAGPAQEEDDEDRGWAAPAPTTMLPPPPPPRTIVAILMRNNARLSLLAFLAVLGVGLVSRYAGDGWTSPNGKRTFATEWYTGIVRGEIPRALPGLDASGSCNATNRDISDGPSGSQSVGASQGVRRHLGVAREVRAGEGSSRQTVTQPGASALASALAAGSAPARAWRGRRRALASRRSPPVDAEWSAALRAARSLAANLTFGDRARLVRGMGWQDWHPVEGMYIGNVPAVPRLGIPSITMQDGPQGFRTNDARLVGTVTCLPSQLAVGATWDRELTYAYARALGEEFRAKGANVILGPGLNLGRVARNGRAAEYMSGEDPNLGAVLGGEYVRGVQSAGVAAVAKHFVANTQETDRDTVNSVIRERALREVYYLPFEAAVHAGVASIMCSCALPAIAALSRCPPPPPSLSRTYLPLSYQRHPLATCPPSLPALITRPHCPPSLPALLQTISSTASTPAGTRGCSPTSRGATSAFEDGS